MKITCRRCSTTVNISALAVAVLLTPLARATEHTYTFTGLATVGARDGGPPVHPYTGVFIIDDDMAASTVYRNNTVMQGFTTTYQGAVRYLGITLNNGEQVQAWGGNLNVNNIQQAEPGTPVPQDFTVQAWTGGSSGTINGFNVFNMYLSFLPVTPNFAWDGLDAYFAGNAEKMLEDGSAVLPALIDPGLTGTALPENLATTFVNGLFLGTNHDLTNTVNPIYSFVETSAPVPEPTTLALILAGGWVVMGAARRKQWR
jgi:hypothetical protein